MMMDRINVASATALSAQWYVIMCSPLLAMRKLRDQGIDCFCPLEQIRVGEGAKRRTKEIPLFGIYAFVQVSDPSLLTTVVRETEGVGSVIGCSPWQHGTPIDSTLVEAMRAHGPFETSELLILARSTADIALELMLGGRIDQLALRRIKRRMAGEASRWPFNPGEQVRPRDGAFAGHVAQLDSIDNKGRASLLMRIMGRLTPVVVDVGLLDPVTAAPDPAGHE